MDIYFWIVFLTVMNVIIFLKSGTDFVYKRWFWASLISVITAAFVAGQMWNHINGPPFAVRNPNTKENIYIYPYNTRFQLVAESFIVWILYCATSASFILLSEAFELRPSKVTTKKVKEYLKEKSRLNYYKFIMIYAGAIIFLVSFSLLVSVFRKKMPSYPFRILFE